MNFSASQKRKRWLSLDASLGFLPGMNLLGRRPSRRNPCHLAVLLLIVAAALGSLTFSWVGLTFGPRNSHRVYMKHFPVAEYHGLPAEEVASVPRPLRGRLFHVAKEFGEASMGGLGSVLTALTAAQAAAGMEVNVVIPAYRYLYEKYQFELEEAATVITEVVIRSTLNPWHIWDDWNPLQALAELLFYGPGPGRVLRVRSVVYRLVQHGIGVYMVSPGDVAPFSDAFIATSSMGIYACKGTFPSEFKDMFFSAVVAQFLAQEHERAGVGYVHLHGATNALVAPLLRLRFPKATAGPEAPVIVYTLHDYLDETTYYIRRWIIERFVPFPFESDPSTHALIAGRLFLSSYGIRSADMVTCVSRVLPDDMLSGSLDFTNKELVLEDLLDQASRGRFYGIGNGVDLNHFNPFENQQLKAAGLEFRPGTNPMEQKLKARQYLVEKGLISPEKAHLKIVLFVGRFQWNKGLDLCVMSVEDFKKRGILLVVMGQRNDFHTGSLEGDDGVLLIDNQPKQQEFGIFLRMAADLVFIPSRTEAFGLVAAEGMLFGSLVISTGVGGLRDFLIDRTVSKELHNSYLFDHQNLKTMKAAIHEAADYLESLDLEGRGSLSLRLMKTAQGMSWSREGGPTDHYSAVYHLAKKKQEADQRELPLPSRHVDVSPMF